jgi:hypothetical protein
VLDLGVTGPGHGRVCILISVGLSLILSSVDEN